MKNAQKISRRKLPHIFLAGATYFVTSNLHGALPKSVLEKLKKEYEQKVHQIKLTGKNADEIKIKLAILQQQHFRKYDQYLDQVMGGPTFLAEEKIADILKERFHRYDGQYYDLIAYTVMSNHFHLLIDTSIQLKEREGDTDYFPNDYVNLSKIIGLIKGASARYANLALGRSGRFWTEEYFDRMVRSDRECLVYQNYITQNPVRAGLVKEWEDFPHTYLKK